MCLFLFPVDSGVDQFRWDAVYPVQKDGEEPHVRDSRTPVLSQQHAKRGAQFFYACDREAPGDDDTVRSVPYARRSREALPITGYGVNQDFRRLRLVGKDFHRVESLIDSKNMFRSSFFLFVRLFVVRGCVPFWRIGRTGLDSRPPWPKFQATWGVFSTGLA